MKDASPRSSRWLPDCDHSADFDVVILGAGINGAGLFRDLCAQGVKCLIVDKADFGSGTSAAPSRLIHGGLKYLETGELGLVAQSTLERNLLLKNAPHVVKPLPTLIPIFSWTRGVLAAVRTLFGATSAPRSRGAILIKIGLTMYDFYGARHRIMPKHRFLGKRKALREMPGLTPSIVAAGIYHDAMITGPERLVFELIKDGMDANPASAVANYTVLERCSDGHLTFAPDGARTFTVRPAIVVNAAGPWIDDVNRSLGMPSKLIGGTKGSHILLRHDELVKSLNGQMIYFEADDGRICLVFDYLGLALVGSSDIPADDPDRVRCEPAEIDYFLASLRSLMPALCIEHDQIVYAYSGIRPLPASDASVPGLISRDHSAPLSEPDSERPFPVISLVGGKWTTFRGFAEEVADAILQRLSRTRSVDTRTLAIGGGKAFPADPDARERWLDTAIQSSGADRPFLERLLDRYGTSALAIACHTANHGGNSYDLLPNAADYTAGEIDYIARHECVAHLADVLMRRTTLAISGQLTVDNLRTLADTTGSALGWSPERIDEEIDSVTALLSGTHDLQIDSAVRSSGDSVRPVH